MENQLGEHYILLRFISCFLLGYWWCNSGVVLQWITTNPLACPVSLGITGLPVSVWMLLILLGIAPDTNSVLLIMIPVFFVVHFIAYFYMKKFNTKSKFFSSHSFILFGIGINLTLAALYSFVHFYYSAKGEGLPSSLWFGLLKIIDLHRFLVLLIGSLFFIFFFHKILCKLNLLSLGKDLASNVLDINILEKKVMLLISLLLCFLVFTGGVFAFWGLILPHLIRLVPSLNRSINREFYLGGCISGLLLASIDYLCFEYPIAGAELPVGLISSILGPIFLIFLIVRNSIKTSTN